MDGLIRAASRSQVVVGTEVDIQKSVARSIGAYKPGLHWAIKYQQRHYNYSNMEWWAHVVLRPGNGRDAPFDGVSAEHECAAGGGRLGPRHAELGYG